MERPIFVEKNIMKISSDHIINRHLLSGYFLKFSFLVLFLITTNSCEKEEISVYECNTTVVPTFKIDIQPILKTNCMNSNCHVKFEQYSYVKKYADNNKLAGSIQHKKGYSKMPKDKPKLDDNTIKLITCWIQNGAPE